MPEFVVIKFPALRVSRRLCGCLQISYSPPKRCHPALFHPNILTAIPLCLCIQECVARTAMNNPHCSWLTGSGHSHYRAHTNSEHFVFHSLNCSRKDIMIFSIQFFFVALPQLPRCRCSRAAHKSSHAASIRIMIFVRWGAAVGRLHFLSQ